MVCALRPWPAAAQDATFFIFGQGQRIGVETVTVLVTDDTFQPSSVTTTVTVSTPMRWPCPKMKKVASWAAAGEGRSAQTMRIAPARRARIMESSIR